MLDLDSLAETCAKAVNENQAPWRQAVWSKSFQSVAVNMTDGEVTTLLQACPSVAHFEALLKFLEEEGRQEKPYATLIAAAQAAKQGLSDWIRQLI